jgi:predicted DNA-binding ribbon-helix-helix protein
MGQKTNEGRVKQSIVFEKWMIDAIKEIAQERGLTFTAVVTELLRQELAVMGYSMGIGREATDGSEKEPGTKRA